VDVLLTRDLPLVGTDALNEGTPLHGRESAVGMGENVGPQVQLDAAGETVDVGVLDMAVRCRRVRRTERRVAGCELGVGVSANDDVVG